MLLGSSATLDGIGKVIADFYGGERKEVRPVPGSALDWTLHRASGAQIERVRVVLKKGRYRFERTE